jgi:ERCC4-related helicase
VYTGQLKLPQTPEDFDWTNLLENKNARDYQVQCFIEALQQDLVAVLPTGAGKTLIASMLIKRMKELNPEKMGLFIVDRIPLVYQQAKVSHSQL